MVRSAPAVVLLASLLAVAAPAAGVPAVAASPHADSQSAGAVERPAQIGTLTLDNGTVDRVLVRTLRVDRATIGDRSNDRFRSLFGDGTRDVLVLHNVTLERVALSNAAVRGVRVAQSAGAGGATAVPDAGALGAVRRVTIGTLSVEHLVVPAGRADRAVSGPPGGVFANVTAQLEDILSRGNGTSAGPGQRAGAPGSDSRSLYVDAVDAGRVRVDRFRAARLQRVTPSEQRTPTSAPTRDTADFVVGRVRVGNATADRMATMVLAVDTRDGANATRGARAAGTR
ncbi:MAG: hypothetical protein ABEJ31_07640 [Haloarculaceae archaeon]